MSKKKTPFLPEHRDKYAALAKSLVVTIEKMYVSVKPHPVAIAQTIIARHSADNFIKMAEKTGIMKELIPEFTKVRDAAVTALKSFDPDTVFETKEAAAKNKPN